MLYTKTIDLHLIDLKKTEQWEKTGPVTGNSPNRKCKKSGGLKIPARIPDDASGSDYEK
jgi:hypothetical protein